MPRDAVQCMEPRCACQAWTPQQIAAVRDSYDPESLAELDRLVSHEEGA